MVVKGDVAEMVEDIVRNRVVCHFENFARRSPKSVIMVVPSTRDIIHPWCAFPQTAFTRNKQWKSVKDAGSLQKNIFMLSNPCVASVNEVHFAISTTDILMHLASEEFSRFCC